ncbi:hypothetical protein MIR68_009695 [Amoeboaphelidium protococcarum]|nr:hypothetical protein MIR68_009695 [Amoeboaphelidium protococcarum]
MDEEDLEFFKQREKQIHLQNNALPWCLQPFGCAFMKVILFAVIFVWIIYVIRLSYTLSQ